MVSTEDLGEPYAWRLLYQENTGVIKVRVGEGAERYLQTFILCLEHREGVQHEPDGDAGREARKGRRSALSTDGFLCDIVEVFPDRDMFE